MEPIDEASTSEPRPHPPPQPLPAETEEDDLLREPLVRAIRRDPADPDQKGDSNGKGDVRIAKYVCLNCRTCSNLFASEFIHTVDSRRVFC